MLDSDDLLADPAAMAMAYCNSVGIRFMPEALRWEPGARDEVSWWDGGSFHENLRNSDGLKRQRTRSVDMDRAPARVRTAYDALIEHYEHMHRYRLQTSASVSAVD